MMNVISFVVLIRSFAWFAAERSILLYFGPLMGYPELLSIAGLLSRTPALETL